MSGLEFHQSIAMRIRRRAFAAAEARAAGRGGIAAVSRVTRIAASTIGRGLKELDAPQLRRRPIAFAALGEDANR